MDGWSVFPPPTPPPLPHNMGQNTASLKLKQELLRLSLVNVTKTKNGTCTSSEKTKENGKLQQKIIRIVNWSPVIHNANTIFLAERVFIHFPLEKPGQREVLTVCSWAKGNLKYLFCLKKCINFETKQHPYITLTKPRIAKNRLILTKAHSKSLTAQTCSLKRFFSTSKLWRCSQSPPEYSLNNVTTSLNTDEQLRVHRLKKKLFSCPSPTSSSVSGTAFEKHAWCAQQVPLNFSEALLDAPKQLLYLLCRHWRGIKQENGDTWKMGLDDKMKWNFLLYWTAVCPMLNDCKQDCLISNSRPSLKLHSGQVG